MEQNHEQILNFLNSQERPIELSEFPLEITSLYEEGKSEGSLYYEMAVVLKGLGYVDKMPPPAKYFLITNIGKLNILQTA